MSYRRQHDQPPTVQCHFLSNSRRRAGSDGRRRGPPSGVDHHAERRTLDSVHPVSTSITDSGICAANRFKAEVARPADHQRDDFHRTLFDFHLGLFAVIIRQADT